MAVTLESFEELTETPNSPLSFEYGEFGFLQPGFLSPFPFALRAEAPRADPRTTTTATARR